MRTDTVPIIYASLTDLQHNNARVTSNYINGGQCRSIFPVLTWRDSFFHICHKVEHLSFSIIRFVLANLHITYIGTGNFSILFTDKGTYCPSSVQWLHWLQWHLLKRWRTDSNFHWLEFIHRIRRHLPTVIYETTENIHWMGVNQLSSLVSPILFCSNWFRFNFTLLENDETILSLLSYN